MDKVIYSNDQIEKVLVLLDKVKVEGLQSMRNIVTAEMILRSFEPMQCSEGKENSDGNNEHS